MPIKKNKINKDMLIKYTGSLVIKNLLFLEDFLAFQYAFLFGQKKQIFR